MATRSKVRTKRPTVSIIGVGRVGHAFAQALHSAGYPIVALVFHDSAAAARSLDASRNLFPQALRLGSDKLEQLPASDIVLITTPDDAIETTAERLAALHKGKRNRIVLHTSGALSSDVLESLAAAGFSTGSIHPLVAIDHNDGASALRGAFYCIEGQKLAQAVAQLIARDFKGTAIHIKAEHKALYHAAAVMASPHLVALFDLAVELLVISGVKSDDARNILLPLVESTTKNLRHARSPSRALTGTFARGDVGTVKRHLQALSQGKPRPPREALEIYKLLGLRSLPLAKSLGVDPKKIKQITKLLKGKR